MTFLENVDKAKLQRILLITISVLVLAALALLLVIIVMSIDSPSLKESNMEFSDLVIEEKDITSGSLILADEEHPFSASTALTATMQNCQEFRNNNRGDATKGPYYSMNDVQLSTISVGAAHSLLIAAEEAIGNDDLLIKYAFNSNDGKTAEYNTGMLMFLTNYDEEKLGREYSEWLDKNAYKFGFVKSFEDAYRYVGTPHAEYMANKKLSLADYIAYLKENTSNEKGLVIKSADGTEYYVYYASVKAGDTIKVPSDSEGVISGTNEGGVIVTCELE